MLANDPITQARIDLVTALRAAVRHGLNEGVCNHFSMTVPGREELFLVNPQGLHWSEITPSDLVMADGAGNIVEGKYPVEATAFFIHARIHAGNPRAKVVLHTHMPYATALTSIQGGRIEMCTQNAFRYFNRIAYDEAYAGVALSLAGRRPHVPRHGRARTSCSCATTASSSPARPWPRPTTISIISSARRWCRCWRCRPAGPCTISTRRWPCTRPIRSRARPSRPCCISSC